MNNRLLCARKTLKLSREFVAKYIGTNVTDVMDIESGRRKVSAEELAVFSELYGIEIDELKYGKQLPNVDDQAFFGLSDTDKEAVACLYEKKTV